MINTSYTALAAAMRNLRPEECSPVERVLARLDELGFEIAPKVTWNAAPPPPNLDTVMAERGAACIDELTTDDIYRLDPPSARTVAVALLATNHLLRIDLAQGKKDRWYSEFCNAQAQMRDAERELAAAKNRSRGEA